MANGIENAVGTADQGLLTNQLQSGDNNLFGLNWGGTESHDPTKGLFNKDLSEEQILNRQERKAKWDEFKSSFKSGIDKPELDEDGNPIDTTKKLTVGTGLSKIGGLLTNLSKNSGGADSAGFQYDKL